MGSLADRIPAIRYRIIERVGADASEWTWMEVDRGTFTANPGWYTEPSMDDAAAYAAKFNREDREIQFWTEAHVDETIAKTQDWRTRALRAEETLKEIIETTRDSDTHDKAILALRRSL